ncbi:unnamed protein product [Paramecium pentaurelia]|uniref:Uncharacterized protein n=1 Tax=Paramecium pentaurelia TaxID=43138 RepID=A0A8S1YIJ3_9CILI|nr:unnamed protein product [Paramecium pentaurelia]
MNSCKIAQALVNFSTTKIRLQIIQIKPIFFQLRIHLEKKDEYEHSLSKNHTLIHSISQTGSESSRRDKKKFQRYLFFILQTPYQDINTIQLQLNLKLSKTSTEIVIELFWHRIYGTNIGFELSTIFQIPIIL